MDWRLRRRQHHYPHNRSNGSQTMDLTHRLVCVSHEPCTSCIARIYCLGSDRFGDVEVDLERRVVRKKGAEVKFTPAEYNLLTFFLQNPDRPLSRDMILNSVWGYESFPNTRTVDAHVVRLRQKLETDPIAPRYFITLHKVGYRFLP